MGRSESELRSQLSNWLATMVRLQLAHNVQVHPEWDKQCYRFSRAVWIECGELMDHYGWKWWKHQTPNLEQVKLELVDIWHFGLSDLMVSHGEDVVDLVTTEVTSCLLGKRQSIAFLDSIEALAIEALRGHFSISNFVTTMRALPMTFEELFTIYVGKNTLNLFRQANGYKDGSYHKTWFGREDNEHLAELAATLDIDSAGYVSELQILLSNRYLEYVASLN